MTPLEDMTFALPRVIVIDGEPGAGKTTQVELVAHRLNYTNVTSGMLFCAGAASVRLAGVSLHDQQEVVETVLGTNIDFEIQLGRKPLVSVGGIDVSDGLFSQINKGMASRLASIPEIATYLDGRLRSLPASGRWVFDRGTENFPDANLKFWLDASPYSRAVRRCGQLAAQGEHVSFNELLYEHTRRELLDRARRKLPPDVIKIDTSLLDAEAVYAKIANRILHHPEVT